MHCLRLSFLLRLNNNLDSIIQAIDNLKIEQSCDDCIRENVTLLAMLDRVPTWYILGVGVFSF